MQHSAGGRGWKFPIQVDHATGRIRTSPYEEDIAESIRIILSTSKGERVMRHKFGCGLREFMFDGTDGTNLTLLKSTIVEAISMWEPRVRDVKVEASVDRSNPSLVTVSISYVVRMTQLVQSLTIPVNMQGPMA